MYEEDLAKRKGGLKLKFKEIKEEFDKLVKQVVAFVPMSLKATKVEFEKNYESFIDKNTKRQKIDDKDAQSTEEKEKEPVKKMGKRRKQIQGKGYTLLRMKLK
ncbi:hypothetical protein Tco_1493495 [Tanacetum coccineum]